MRKIFSLFSGVAFLLGAILFFAPNFINLENYKQDISAKAQKFIGRELNINGNIELSVLPVPTFTAVDVSIPNLDGGKSLRMASFNSIEVRVSLFPLLIGKVQILGIKLVKPVVFLEGLPGKPKSWPPLITEQKRPQDSSTSTNKKSFSNEGLERGVESEDRITIANLTIEQGTIIFSNQQTGHFQKIKNINTSIETEGEDHPFNGFGNFTFDEIDLGFSFRIGKLSIGSAIPAALELKSDLAKLQITGQIADLKSSPKFNGTVNVESQKVSRLLFPVFGDTILKDFLARPMTAKATFFASMDSLVSENIEIALEKERFRGTLSIKMGKTTNASLNLATRQLNLDAILNPVKVPPKSPEPKRPKSTENSLNDVSENLSSSDADYRKNVPHNLNASLSLTADTIKYRGGLIRRGRINAELSNGEIIINQLSGEGPGATTVDAFGFFPLNSSKVFFDGNIDVQSSDLRAVSDWLDLNIDTIPRDRLRKLSFKSKVAIAKKQLRISKMELLFDSSKITGAIVAAIRKRPSLGVSINLDKINLDAYLQKNIRATNIPREDSGEANLNQRPDERTNKKSKKTSDLHTTLAILDQFDANIKIYARQVVLQQENIRNIFFDGMLHNGNLVVRDIKFKGLAGVKGKAKGTLENLVGIPRVKNFTFSAKVPSTSKIYKYLGKKLPHHAPKVRNISFKAVVNGTIGRLHIDSELSSGSLNMKLGGNLGFLNGVNAGDISIKLRHASFQKMLRLFSIPYKPKTDLGPVRLRAILRIKPKTFLFSLIDANLGKLRLSGDFDLNLTQLRPQIRARITANDIILDDFFPAARSAGVDLKIIPASLTKSSRPNNSSKQLVHVALSKRWSKDLIDFSILSRLDANIALKSDSLAAGTYQFSNVETNLKIKNGIMYIEKFFGSLFGGKFDTVGSLDILNANKLQLKTSITGADLRLIQKAFQKPQSILGEISWSSVFTGQMPTVFDLASSITGTGRLKINKLNISDSRKHISRLAGLTSLIAEINKIGSILGGGKKAIEDTGFNSTFSAKKGKFHFPDILLQTHWGAAQASARLSLPDWKIDLTGRLKISENAIALLLSKKGRQIPDVPFQIYGSLDNPRLKVKKARISVENLPLKADKLLRKIPKGAGKLLDGLFGSHQGKFGSPPEKEGPQQKPLTPKTLIENLLKF
ncbi:MAG: hypothetical protein CFH06_00043 [Alphaproteobacteria bacterium MarineAlpha3_Bin5]|nr:hypothetical protein [Magnetovibrio sp.]PPR80157.1 MAG: hypothetical protein CFH06_00043 [Alphaproteobacteria bacterium MarineAlpha3_Bin5]